ncbi:MAG: ORF6N domain-containing protein [Bacteroidetes bacterium]|nr:ORF6N domain-containing protein [Bacteroidota bacterium]
MSTELQVKLETISGLIHYIRGEKVILDVDLARLYEVPTRVLKQAVRRNLHRFPGDFMFELSDIELDSLRSQIVILTRGQHYKYLPFAFTEQGVAMLSSVLNSEKAIEVNIAIIRAFVQMRKFLETNKELAEKIEELERTVSSHGEDILLIFETIKQLMYKKSQQMEPVGYKIHQVNRS